jgi:hypothetical protein
VPNLNQDQLRRLARLGAVARLEQLREEEAAIRAEFPELFGRGEGGRAAAGRGRRGRRKSAGAGAAAASSTGAGSTGAAAAGSARGGRRKRTMSAAGRRAVSERMRKYWAERRKAKAGK